MIYRNPNKNMSWLISGKA